MKKSTGIIVFLILLSVCLVFAACENVSNETITEPGVDPEPVHTHTFSDIWSKDADYHWHAATCEHTDEVDRKAAHAWNNGTITTPATEEAEGEITYTCTVCGATKSKVIAKLKKSSEGLAFALKNDDTYEVTGIGTCTDTDVVIPVQYQGDAVTSIGNNAFDGCSSLTSVTIPSSVTIIGVSAFHSCSGLTSVTFAEGSQLMFIGESAFYDCRGLTSVTIPSVTIIGSSAFGDCSSLISVTIGSGISEIYEYAFYNCSGLTSVTIPSSLTIIGSSAFRGCSGLTSIYYTGDVAGWCGIAGLNNLMSYGSSTKSLYISGAKVEGDLVIHSSVTSIVSSAFSGCSGLTSVTIGSGVTSIGSYAFAYCSGLTSITIPSSVTSIGEYAFGGCSSLTSVTIGSGVTSIGGSSFRGCSGLTSITIPSSVTSIGFCAFAYCSGLTSVTYQGTCEQWKAITKGVNWAKNMGVSIVTCRDGDCSI